MTKEDLSTSSAIAFLPPIECPHRFCILYQTWRFLPNRSIPRPRKCRRFSPTGKFTSKPAGCGPGFTLADQWPFDNSQICLQIAAAGVGPENIRGAFAIEVADA